MAKKIPINLKYRLYEESVQNYESDIDFINAEFKKIRSTRPLSLREDFGGTAAMACAWVKQSSAHRAWAIDLDKEPQDYGMEHHWGPMNPKQRERMNFVQGNVLDVYKFKAQVATAFNFSYFVLKKREELLTYFKSVSRGLDKDGIFFLDIFGGIECFQELEETTEYKDHDYLWDCDRYNPINSEVTYHIHFLDKVNNASYKKAFSYDWRHWSIREVTECLEEAGFSRTLVYWEGEDDEGEGNGEFYESSLEENCESWVAYILGIK